MSETEFAKITAAIHEHLPEPEEGRFWYPLSRPTYGAEEVCEALDSMWTYRTSMWAKTRRFEEAFAEKFGCADAVMVNSGSSADLLLAFSLTDPLQPRLQPGDEILIPAVTWPTQIWSAVVAGLQVKLVDVDPSTLNVDPQSLRRAIGPRTRAIFVVHLMGSPADMDAVQAIADEYGLEVIEDCCEALGAQHRGRQVGTLGRGGAYSFFFSHHICTMEGGMIACPDAETADRLRILRSHGWSRDAKLARQAPAENQIDPRYLFLNLGFNLRPTEVQASFGLHQLDRVDDFAERRNEQARRFFEFSQAHAALERITTVDGAEPSWFALPAMLHPSVAGERQSLFDQLEREGIETRPMVAGNLARQPAAELIGSPDPASLPGAEEIHHRGFYIGLSPLTPEVQFERMLATLERALDGISTRTTRTRRKAA